MSDKLNLLLENTGDMALKRRARKIVEAINPQKNEKILDVGCGDGYYLHLLSHVEPSAQYTGTDFDKDGLKSARKNLKKTIPLVQADLMQKLPFKTNQFNKIVMSEVAEHLPDDVKGLKEVYRVLKPGGVLALTVPDADYPLLWDPINWLLEALFNTHVKSGFFAGLWNQHIRLYKRKHIEKVLKQAGFKIENSEGVTFWCLPFNHYIINATARLLYGGSLSPDIANSISKYKTNPKRPLLLDIAFGVVNFIDHLNDIWHPKDIGVSVFVKARK